MTKQELINLAKECFEIELTYKDKKYSLTYYDDNRKDYISFYKFDKDVLDVSSIDELWNSSYKGIPIKEIFLSLKWEVVDYYLF